MSFFYSKKNKLVCFCIFAIALYCFHIFLLLRYPYGNQMQLFFNNLYDIHADFSNLLICIADRDPYMNEYRGGVLKDYLPLTYLLLYPFSRFAHVSNTDLVDTYSNPRCILAVTYFITITTVLFLHSCYCFCKKNKISLIVLLPLLFSRLFIYNMDRLNFIIVSVSCVLYFLSFYDSENKVKRYFALSMICFASVMKIYPVFFGILLIKEKRYKDILYCLIFGLFVSFAPFLFFKGGFNNIPILINNLSYYSEYPGNQFLKIVYRLLFDKDMPRLIIRFNRIFLYFLLIVAFIISILSKNKMYTLFFVFCLMFFTGNITARYFPLFLVPVLIFYFNTENRFPVFIDILLFIYLFMLFVPLIISFGGYELNSLMVAPFTFFVMLVLMIDFFRDNCLAKLLEKK